MKFLDKWFAPLMGAAILLASFFYHDASAQITPPPGGGGKPADPVNSVQFNNAGAFGGSADLTWTGSQLLSPTYASETDFFGNANRIPFSATSDGYAVSLTAGNGGATSGIGGSITLLSGESSGTSPTGPINIITNRPNAAGGASGDILLQTGAPISGVTGSVLFSPGEVNTASFNATGLNFLTTGQRISGDFSNATRSSRVLFQSSTTNGGTIVGAIPNGTATAARYVAYSSSDANNASLARFYTDGTAGTVGIDSWVSGTGTQLPIQMQIANVPYLEMFTTGRVYIGATPADDGSSALKVNGKVTASSFDNVAITAPASTATLTLASGKTFTVNNSVTLSGTDGTTMTLPSASSTLAIAGANSDITSMTAVTTLSTAAGVAVHGTNTNDNAAAGYKGEYVESVITVAVNVGTSLQWADMTSISLTAGDWDVTGICDLNKNGAVINSSYCGISSTSGNSGTGLSIGSNEVPLFLPTANSDGGGSIPSYRVSLSGTTLIYLKNFSDYSGAIPKFYGRISARRFR